MTSSTYGTGCRCCEGHFKLHRKSRNQNFRLSVRGSCKYGVGRVEHPAEQIQLFAQNLESQLLRLVVAGNEINHGNVALLTVAMAASNALLDALRIPGQIVVDDRLAELQVQTLRAGLRADQDSRTGPELVHERQPQATSRLGMCLEEAGPSSCLHRQGLLRAVVIVNAAE